MTSNIGLKYFSHKELACPATGVVLLAYGFGEKLDKLREVWGKPLLVTSCCRSKAHNAKVGGRPKSFHLYDAEDQTGVLGTCAVDIRMTDARERWMLINMALELDSWSIGVAPTFLHFDRRTDYPLAEWPHPIIFTY